MAIDARAARRERQLRLKRALALGAAGSLVFFLGIIATQEVSRPDPVQPAVSFQNNSQNTPSARLPEPRIRTRTS